MFESPFHSLDLTGKTIIVTGGGSGIGRATSVMLAARGAHVAIADRDDEGAVRRPRRSPTVAAVSASSAPMSPMRTVFTHS